MITSGRNGLPPNLLEWLKSSEMSSKINRIIYSSCNPKITFREMQIFLSGDNAFSVEDYVILDMHPCTEYRGFFGVLVRRKVLVLPVGGLKAGKTYFFAQQMIKHFPVGTLQYLGRDDIFFGFKKQGNSLKRAKLLTHQRITNALCDNHRKATVLYLDSCNGTPEGRDYYQNIFFENHGAQQQIGHPSSNLLVVCLCFVRKENASDQLWLELVDMGLKQRKENDIPIHKSEQQWLKLYQLSWDQLKYPNQNDPRVQVLEIPANTKCNKLWEFHKEQICYELFRLCFGPSNTSEKINIVFISKQNTFLEEHFH
ncbi:hypothetical protein RFI_01352 [Reticulomyxa filosa]|uniref:Uncharacterized protein n=1 Tax=Reticulomyxa filosa TaxID=46433 RepID=X6PCB5_RETFI|nr:hypothetical protein RFI_01352 [Reticulomyxa filosa]|eukprot:ETO35709.1 hypothetical protein RFI_01352 [Reticulomyxa filosa]